MPSPGLSGFFDVTFVASIERQQAGRIMAALILIVDDNDQLRGVFAQILRSYGYEAIEAKTGLRQ